MSFFSCAKLCFIWNRLTITRGYCHIHSLLHLQSPIRTASGLVKKTGDITRSTHDRATVNKSSSCGVTPDNTENVGSKLGQDVKVSRRHLQMRESMKTLHNLGTTNDFIPTAYGLRNSNIDNGESLKEDRSSVTCDESYEKPKRELNTAAIERKYSFLRKDSWKKTEKVLEMPYGTIRIDERGRSEKGKNNNIGLPHKDKNVHIEQKPFLPDKESSFSSNPCKPEPKLTSSSQYHDRLKEQESVTEPAGKLLDSDLQMKAETKGNNAQFLMSKSDTSHQHYNIFEQEYFKGVVDKPDLGHAAANTKRENIFDEQYFEGATGKYNVHERAGLHEEPAPRRPDRKSRYLPSSTEKENIFDEQYFQGADVQQTVSELRHATSNLNESKDKTSSSAHSVFAQNNTRLDEQIPIVPRDNVPQSKQTDTAMPTGEDHRHTWRVVSVERTSYEKFDTVNKSKSVHRIQRQPFIRESHETEKDPVFVEKKTKQEKRAQTTPQANTENPTTAYDMAMKIRMEEKGYRVTPDETDNTSQMKGDIYQKLLIHCRAQYSCHDELYCWWTGIYYMLMICMYMYCNPNLVT